MKKNYQKLALEAHKKYKGKWATKIKMPLRNSDDLSIAYSPGVAAPCLEIKKNKNNSYVYTNRKNTIAIISNGTAVLGLGDIGAEAAMPVMEGKSVLFKKFADIDVLPIVINSKDEKEVIKFVQLLEPSIAGVNLEDIAAPACVTIERKLKKLLNIPIFHDDQHGTAIVTTAALLNAARLTKKKLENLTVLLSGTGAAGSSIARMIKKIGIKTIYAYNKKGMVVNKKKQTFVVKELIDEKIISLWNSKKGTTLAEGIKNIDIFIGVSAPKILTREMIENMNADPWIFAMANPEPEIHPEIAYKGGAQIVGTGRSDYPNQVNNLLAFPGIFKGALEANATQITDNMKMAAAIAISKYINTKDLNYKNILPSNIDPKVTLKVAKYVKRQAIIDKVVR